MEKGTLFNTNVAECELFDLAQNDNEFTRTNHRFLAFVGQNLIIDLARRVYGKIHYSRNIAPQNFVYCDMDFGDIFYTTQPLVPTNILEARQEFSDLNAEALTQIAELIERNVPQFKFNFIFDNITQSKDNETRLNMLLAKHINPLPPLNETNVFDPLRKGKESFVANDWRMSARNKHKGVRGKGEIVLYSPALNTAISVSNSDFIRATRDSVINRLELIGIFEIYETLSGYFIRKRD